MTALVAAMTAPRMPLNRIALEPVSMSESPSPESATSLTALRANAKVDPIERAVILLLLVVAVREPTSSTVTDPDRWSRQCP